jgi:hypothetical protein
MKSFNLGNIVLRSDGNLSRKKRIEIIKKIESIRKSPLICYINGDRENVSTRVASDIIRIFYEHLEEMKKYHDNLDLFIYTRGGDVLTPWRLINLLREYSEKITVIVPFRCYSAGTLIALGADNILMTKMGELGPIDPSVTNAFNPQDTLNNAAKIPISVEDVSAYAELAYEMFKISNINELTKVFDFLAQKVHPLALGNVYRNYVLIRSIGHRLLNLHIGNNENERKQEIIDYLTEKLYAHNHLISRKEAGDDIGLPVKYTHKEEEKLFWQLYLEFEKDLKLNHPFNPAELLKNENEIAFEVSGGIIESMARLDSFIFKGIITRVPEENQPGGVNVNIQHQGWQKINLNEEE